MKYICIGDIHGKNIWKQIVQKEQNADKIIFIGDYFDSRDNISGTQQLHNFKEICELKKSNPSKIVLLIGNHDFHYINGIGEQYSGFQNGFQWDFGDEIQHAMNNNLVQMCFVQDKFLFIHAGVTNTWVRESLGNDVDLEKNINELFNFQPRFFKFTSGKSHSPYGDDICQTPIWVRPKSLLSDAVEGFIQVVGHTTQDKILVNNHHSLILIDTLGTSEEYLVIENNTPRAEKLGWEEEYQTPIDHSTRIIDVEKSRYKVKEIK